MMTPTGRAFAVLSMLASVVPASAQEPASIYKGKTIRIVVGYSAGGGYDVNARILARHIGTHIPGNPNVIVENMPGASSLKSVRYLEAGPKDGTVMTAFSAGLVVQSITEPQMFPIKLTDYAWVGSIAQEIRVCYVRSDLGVTTFEQLRQLPAVSFGETGSGSAGYVDQSIMRTVLGVKVRTIIGYPGSAEKEIAIQRGELPAGTDAAGVIRTATALIYYRLFVAGEPASQDLADSAAAAAAAAARAGALPAPRPK